MKLIYQNKWTDQDVEAHWDAVADQYVDSNNSVEDTHNQRFAKSVSFLDLPESGRILNITSRDCELNDYISRINPRLEVLNAEISAQLMRVAAEIRPEVKQLKLSSYSVLPFEDESFDRVASLETLEHVAEPVVFLKELWRVAKPNTIMVLSCPPLTCEPAYRFYTAVFGGHGEGPHRFLPSREVKQMFRESGWQLLHHEGSLLIPVGPHFLKTFGEWAIRHFKFLSELGIRQFYVCRKA